MSVLNDLKYNYNYNLIRWNNGCDYCEKHLDEVDKWLPELLDITENLNYLLDEIMKHEKVSDDDILKGFIIKD